MAQHFVDLGWKTIALTNAETAELSPTWTAAFSELIVGDGSNIIAQNPELNNVGCDLLIVDDYSWTKREEALCRPWAKRILVIDDLANRSHNCDTLCDASSGRDEDDYKDLVPRHAQVFTGPQYALLRPDFVAMRCNRQHTNIENVERVFVCVGATDPDGAILQILQGFKAAHFQGDIDIVIASNAPHLSELRKRVATWNGGRASLHIDERDVAALMSEADLAIGNAGSSSWERCCLGLPAIAIPTSDNQQQTLEDLKRAGAVKPLKRSFSTNDFRDLFSKLIESGSERRTMSANASRLCDGLGAARLAEAIKDVQLDKTGTPIRLEPVTAQHENLLFEWQQIPETRRFARTIEIPSQAKHGAWFKSKLADQRCIFSLIRVGTSHAGSIRLDYDVKRKAFEVSINVIPDFMRRGVAGEALAITRRMLPRAKITAWVRHENSASHALFRRMRYNESLSGKSNEGLWYVSDPIVPSRRKASNY